MSHRLDEFKNDSIVIVNDMMSKNGNKMVKCWS